MSLGPAIGVIELRSIARGYVTLDAASKRAVVVVLRAEPISPGKYWIAFHGGEAEVEEALQAAVDASGDSRIDHTLLAAAHPALIHAIATNVVPRPELSSVGALELGSIASTVRATDAALKAAEVTLVDLHLARGIGGKGYVVVSGLLSDVEAAIAAGLDAAGAGWLVGSEIVANPDEATHAAVGTRHELSR